MLALQADFREKGEKKKKKHESMATRRFSKDTVILLRGLKPHEECNFVAEAGLLCWPQSYKRQTH